MFEHLFKFMFQVSFVAGTLIGLFYIWYTKRQLSLLEVYFSSNTFRELEAQKDFKNFILRNIILKLLLFVTIILACRLFLQTELVVLSIGIALPVIIYMIISQYN